MAPIEVGEHYIFSILLSNVLERWFFFEGLENVYHGHFLQKQRNILSRELLVIHVADEKTKADRTMNDKRNKVDLQMSWDIEKG